MKISRSNILGFAAAMALTANTAFAGAVLAGFDSSTLARNDDGSAGFVSFGFASSVNFFGTNYTGANLNNNGNMTFSFADGTFTPSSLTTSGQQPRIAPFFADVDTRPLASGVMQYGEGSFEGHDAFGQTWRNVGYFSNQTAHLNTFQTILVDRSDTGSGNFDIYFNYDTITWNTGQASGGDANGRGGVSAVAGFTSGGLTPTFYQLAGSGIDGAFLDGGLNALNTHNLNRPELGRYLFTVRNGQVNTNVPDNGSVLAMLGLAMASIVALKRKLR